MRIIQLLPGTGTYYCGSCLRDEALAKILHKFGHDVTVVPLYLPVVGEDPDLRLGAPLFFNGINVYLQQHYSLFRHTPAWIDRLVESPAMLRYAARRAGATDPTDLGDMTLSMLNGEHGRQQKELHRLLDWLKAEPKPDLILLSNSMLLGLAPALRAAFTCKIAVSFQGEHTFIDDLGPAASSQVWPLIGQLANSVDHLIAPSKWCADHMAERAGIPRERIHVVHNGIVLDNFPYAYSPPNPPVLGFLARMCPDKGLDMLVEAYILLKRREGLEHLRLRVAGTTTRADRGYVAGLRNRLLHEGLSADVEFLPNIPFAEKRQFLAGLSVLSVPAHYGEAFGLYILEALATGVPVVQPRHAAFPELIETTGGGLLFEPHDVDSLANTLAELLSNPERSRALGKAGRDQVLRRFSVETMAGAILHHAGL